MQIDDKRACRELHEHLFEVIDFLDREDAATIFPLNA